jgi:uncharacterized circularly permuted ATP-grasp superfamily protein/uncharacterized alpha-E superfamily protein
MAERPDVGVARPPSPRPEGDAAGPPLLASYAAPAGHFDELRAGREAVRPHWRDFARYAEGLSAADLHLKQARVARQIHDNGVTYNVYAAADGPARPWALDVLPMVIPALEWEALARGLRQRARLLNAMAADVYGAQRLLAAGLIPPALVLGHPGFLRACHGVRPAQGVFLHQVAFDLGRAPDGTWQVVGTRAQAPSGAGYALENRLTVSRLFPDAFRELRVHMLAAFFRTVQETLLEGAPREGDTPHVVLLTPGPYNETYFEHAYLARYLGFSLVEGGDLTVRDDRVYLKTLTGLRRVHAILRRLDDDFCDPLELRADSTLGVPGLVQAWRAGNVLVANAFGAGVLESPALLGFLPGSCEYLLGEPLALPSVATWWCGEDLALDDAITRLPEMVIKPAFPDARMEPVFAAELDERARGDWSARLRAAPEAYVLQAYLPLSHAPVWHARTVASRALMLRAFLVADGQGDYRAMPGGLSRIAGDDRHVVSGQRGGSSKDTWALSEAPVETFSLLPGRLRPEDIARSQRAVSSRAGENLFWLGRYAERSENCARLLRAVLSRLADTDTWSAGLSAPLVRTCERHGLLSPAPDLPARDAHRLERDLIADMLDRRTGFSLAFNVEQTVRVAGAVRDRLSSDNWRLVNQLHEAFAGASSLSPASPAGPAPAASLAAALELIEEAIVSLVAVGGLEMAHMTRDDGWRFLGIGRYLERLLYVATTAEEVAGAGEVEQPALLEWLLDLSDSTITYRARYMRPPEWLAVADLLLFDRRNPRSAAFQLAKLAKHVRVLPGGDLADLGAEIGRAFAACRAAETAQGDLFASPRSLGDFLRHSQDLACRLSDALTLRYFSHVYEPTQALAAR